MNDYLSISLLASDARPLERDALFRAGMERVSAYRREKVLRFRFRRDRNLSLAAGLLLDKLLSSYGLRERDMEYVENEHGKPYLRSRPDILFSVSHSGDYVVCAVGSVELGVDIEQITLPDWDVVRRCLSDSELSDLLSLPESERAERFTRLWTLKESYLKATGIGIGESFPAFDITPDRPPRLLELGNNDNGYRFHEFGWTGYKGTLCVLTEKNIEVKVPPKLSFPEGWALC